MPPHDLQRDPTGLSHMNENAPQLLSGSWTLTCGMCSIPSLSDPKAFHKKEVAIITEMCTAIVPLNS